MKSKRQILFIHGGMTFKNKKDYIKYLKTRKIKIDKKRWSYEYLDEKLGKKFQIIRPRMPLWENAKYSEWKINFERHIPYIKNNIILIGSSLGGTFLAKYLSENKFPKKIKAICLVAPPFDNSLKGEDLVGGFKLKSDLSKIEENCANLNLFFSKHDTCVPIEHAEKYRKKLPNANIHLLSKKGHFAISTFPELVEMINKDTK